MARRTLLLTILLIGIGPIGSGAPSDSTVAAEKSIKVVATFPVLRDRVQQIGRDRVAVNSLLSGVESEQRIYPQTDRWSGHW